MFKQLIGIAALALSFTAAAQQPHGGAPAHAPWRHPAHAGDHPRQSPKPPSSCWRAGMAGCRYFRTVVQNGGKGPRPVAATVCRQGVDGGGGGRALGSAARTVFNGFRQTEEHAADLKATIAWARATAKVPVWLVGTSRGTQSAAWRSHRAAGRRRARWRGVDGDHPGG